MNVNSELIRRKAEEYTTEMTTFLRDLIAIPSPSGQEKLVAERIEKEMLRVGFDETFIDDYGSVIGRMGDGSPRILYDGHIDTVGVTDPSAWNFPPFSGKIENDRIWGRGASDNKAATVVQVYAAKILKEISGDDFPGTIYVVGSAMEEACDGLALGHVIKNFLNGDVDAVVLGECTNCDVYRGHRGRIEIVVETRGVSCHASAPERGENAVYKMAPVIKEIEDLNEKLKDDPFLGKGTIAVTKVECDTDSMNCVPYGCRIYLDRRLTAGEDRELAVSQIRELPSFNDADARILIFDEPAWTGKIIETEKYYPTWVLEEDHPLVQNAAETYRTLFDKKPNISKWVFSTNGVSSMGQLGIPTIGFGPSEERFAHTSEDQCPVKDLTTACAFYAAFPFYYSK